MCTYHLYIRRFISVSYHEDSTLVADYQWGNAITTADGRVLLARGGISADNADRGIFELQEDGSLEKLEHSGAIALKHPWDIAVSPTGDIFLSDYQSTSLYRLVCDNPGPLLACEEDEGEHGLPYPECNRHFECESGYGGEYCDQGKFNCDSDFCGSAELCAAELYECNWWTNGRYCSEYLELAEFEDNTYTDAPVGIAVNEINEIISVQGSAIRRYSPVAAAWSDIVEDGGTKLWGLTVCPNGNIYYNVRNSLLSINCVQHQIIGCRLLELQSSRCSWRLFVSLLHSCLCSLPGMCVLVCCSPELHRRPFMKLPVQTTPHQQMAFARPTRQLLPSST